MLHTEANTEGAKALNSTLKLLSRESSWRRLRPDADDFIEALFLRTRCVSSNSVVDLRRCVVPGLVMDSDGSPVLMSTGIFVLL